VAAFAELLQVGERKAKVAVRLGWHRVVLGGAQEDVKRVNDALPRCHWRPRPRRDRQWLACGYSGETLLTCKVLDEACVFAGGSAVLSDDTKATRSSPA